MQSTIPNAFQLLFHAVDVTDSNDKNEEKNRWEKRVKQNKSDEKSFCMRFDHIILFSSPPLESQWIFVALKVVVYWINTMPLRPHYY